MSSVIVSASVAEIARLSIRERVLALLTDYPTLSHAELSNLTGANVRYIRLITSTDEFQLALGARVSHRYKMTMAAVRQKMLDTTLAALDSLTEVATGQSTPAQKVEAARTILQHTGPVIHPQTHATSVNDQAQQPTVSINITLDDLNAAKAKHADRAGKLTLDAIDVEIIPPTHQLIAPREFDPVD
jgi:hypothetical protein